MKISVFGTGYVGLVTGVCFAEKGHSVICADIHSQKIEFLNRGLSPIFEPGLEKLIEKNLRLETLQFTSDIQKAIQHSDMLFIAVGTPTDEKGGVDLSQIWQVIDSILDHAEGEKTIVIKSTVPVGTFAKIKEHLRGRGHFKICSNPEFLKEGTAIEDSLNPSRIVLGVEDEKTEKLLRDLYSSFNSEILVMDPASSELTKYAANTMLAARISLMNELSRLSEKMGADIQMIERGIGSDPRIGPQYLKAGLGYGGSCLPKDLRALLQMGNHYDEALPLISAIEETNGRQKDFFFQKIKAQFRSLKEVRIAIWGTSFKAGTDDIRESPSLFLIKNLIDAGAEIHIYDPEAARGTKAYFSDSRLHFHDSMYEAAQSASALIIATDWDEFKSPDFQKLKNLMKSRFIFDGRNIFDPRQIQEQGFNYFAVGRAFRSAAMRPFFEARPTMTFSAAMDSEDPKLY